MDKNNAKKILIVEDEKPIAKALDLKLSHAGFKTVVVYNGEEAMDALKNDKFDLILLDLVMPVMDGFSVLSELKKKNNKIPVVVMTNLSQKEDEEKARDLGATDYLIKSAVPIVEIVSRVEKILS